jgi:hypothetical protein
LISSVLVEGQSAQIALPPENAIEQPAGFHQLIHHLALARGKAGGMERHLDGLPFGEPLRFVMKGPAARILRGHRRGIRQEGNEDRNSHGLIVAPAVCAAGGRVRTRTRRRQDRQRYSFT